VGTLAKRRPNHMTKVLKKKVDELQKQMKQASPVPAEGGGGGGGALDEQYSDDDHVASHDAPGEATGTGRDAAVKGEGDDDGGQDSGREEGVEEEVADWEDPVHDDEGRLGSQAGRRRVAPPGDDSDEELGHSSVDEG
jgi:hypothetical protein